MAGSDPSRKEATITPEHILIGHSPLVQGLAARLRSLVRETVPVATETAYPVWHDIGYRHSK